MTAASIPRHPVTLARLSGLAYLAIILCGLFAQLAVRGVLIDWQDAGATAGAIRDQNTLFRLGIMADLLVFALDIVLAVTFYRLLSPVDRGLALFALSVRLVMVAVMSANVLAMIAPLVLLGETPLAAQLDGPAAEVAALAALELHSEGYVLGLTVFGLYSAALGVLLFRSGYFPAVLGVLMGVSGLSYLTLGIVHFALPALTGAGSLLLLTAALPEFVFTAWLLLAGLSRKKWDAALSGQAPA